MVSAENDRRRPGTIWVRQLDWPTPAVAPLVPATLARLGPESAGRLAAVMGLADAAGVRQRLDTGRRCYAAWVGDELAAYGWVSLEEEAIGELRLRVRLLPGEAYLWDCATVPAFRRRRLYTALLIHMAGALLAEGLCRVWIGADMENIASQAGIARAGFRPVADLVVARALALRLVWVAGRPGVPAALVAEARRVFLGDRDQAWLAALSRSRTAN
jgi:ribosomal protein S18 acetylase RimI-like enzyme